MMGLFKRKNKEAPETEAVSPAADAEAAAPSNYEAWSPEGQEDAHTPSGGGPGVYSPVPLVMEKPQADAAEL